MWVMKADSNPKVTPVYAPTMAASTRMAAWVSPAAINTKKPIGTTSMNLCKSEPSSTGFARTKRGAMNRVRVSTCNMTRKMKMPTAKEKAMLSSQGFLE